MHILNIYLSLLVVVGISCIPITRIYYFHRNSFIIHMTKLIPMIALCLIILIFGFFSNFGFSNYGFYIFIYLLLATLGEYLLGNPFHSDTADKIGFLIFSFLYLSTTIIMFYNGIFSLGAFLVFIMSVVLTLLKLYYLDIPKIKILSMPKTFWFGIYGIIMSFYVMSAYMFIHKNFQEYPLSCIALILFVSCFYIGDIVIGISKFKLALGNLKLLILGFYYSGYISITAFAILTAVE